MKINVKNDLSICRPQSGITVDRYTVLTAIFVRQLALERLQVEKCLHSRKLNRDYLFPSNKSGSFNGVIPEGFKGHAACPRDTSRRWLASISGGMQSRWALDK